jgi:histidinol-phosphate aminotransferase
MRVHAKDYIGDLAPYQPGMPLAEVMSTHGLRPEAIIQLASNENPRGPSPAAGAAARDAVQSMHRYPDQHELARALAAHHGVQADMITLGNGSNDVLDLIARTYLGEGDAAVSSACSFAVYQIATRSAGAANIIVPTKQLGLDLEAMLRAITPQTKVIWLDNPSNPAGTFVPYAEVKAFLRQVPRHILVVLDEAYYEYLAPKQRANSVNWLKQHPNLVLVRTFSKIYGLAGLRVGYGIAVPEITAMLNRARQPFNLNSVALRAAVAALGDQGYVQTSYEQNQRGRAQLQRGFKKLGIAQLPAHGNFVTIQTPDAARINEQLLKHGIIVRPLGAYGMPNYLRISVGMPAQNERLLTALAQIV